MQMVPAHAQLERQGHNKLNVHHSNKLLASQVTLVVAEVVVTLAVAAEVAVVADLQDHNFLSSYLSKFYENKTYVMCNCYSSN